MTRALYLLVTQYPDHVYLLSGVTTATPHEAGTIPIAGHRNSPCYAAKTGDGIGPYGDTGPKAFVGAFAGGYVGIFGATKEERDNFVRRAAAGYPPNTNPYKQPAVQWPQPGDPSPARPAKTLSVEIDEAISALRDPNASVETINKELLDIKIQGDIVDLPTDVRRQLAQLSKALQDTGVSAPEPLKQKLDNMPYLSSESSSGVGQRY
jgi:hypothetical protein